MTLLVHILKIVVPSLRFWVLPGALLFGQTDAATIQATAAPATEIEVAYLSEAESELSDKLAILDIMSSEDAVAPSSSVAKLPLFYFILPVRTYVDTAVYYSRLRIDEFVNSYTRNVFYVFVTALAP
jgi:hypothetical protein